MADEFDPYRRSLSLAARIVALVAGGLLLSLARGIAAEVTDQNGPEQPPAATKDARYAVPSDADRQRAESQIREVYADQLRSAKTVEDRLALARKLEQQGLDVNNTPNERYAALGLARSLAIEAGDPARAVAIIGLTGEHFATRPTMEKAALLTAMSEKGSVALRTQALASARRELDELMKGESYSEAIEMGRAAFAIAKLVRDKEALERISESAKLLRQRQDAYNEFQTAQTRLKDNPTDPQANLVVGRWWLLVKNDVPLGLKHLAASGDKGFSVAAADMAGPKSAKEQREIADQWRTLAGQEAEALRRPVLLRARFWYQEALNGAGGLEKARIQKYMTELDRQLGLEPSDQSFATDTPPGAPTPTTKSTKVDVSKSEWKPPQRNANTAFRSFMGVYMYRLDKNKLYPIVNMNVPKRNLWTQEVQDKVRGRISFEEISYFGSANIAIPANGVYVLTLPNGKLSINDTPTGGAGELTIVKGLHRVTFGVETHGQPSIVAASISLRHKESGEEVVFFNTWKDIQSFLSTPINGQQVLDVSNWKPTEADEVKVNTKTLKVTVGGH